jgi:RNA polymerase subunit RPABC4/transcription elongation factor Spt4
MAARCDPQACAGAIAGCLRGDSGASCGMQCVRCGRVMNLQERRCPGCLASLSNSQISQLEIARHQLGELAGIERAQATSRYARQGASTGAVLGALGGAVSGSLWLILIGGVVGGGVGWFVAWRNWGQFRACALYAPLMLPPTLAMTMNPFAVVGVIAVGMVIGLAVRLNQGR